MISYHSVFQEIERQLNNARHADNESAMRESLAAIRSLTEIVLGSDVNSQQGKTAPKRIETPQVQSVQPVQSLNSLEAKPLEEDGANGSSIFDF